MNIHHLELFYYVAKHQGIGQAVRNIPYGIQQPAVSGQILQLEKALGIRLFHRRPFALTEAGQELYQFITPFFANLKDVSKKLQSGVHQHLRLAASAIVLREHLPDLLLSVRRQYPELKLTLYEANQLRAETLLQNHEIDLAISVLEKKFSSHVQSLSLIQVPMVLLVKRSERWRSASEIFKKIQNSEQALITLPANTILTKLFQGELQRRNIHWPSQIEVDSLDLIRTYVSKGFGIGLSVIVPELSLPKNIDFLSLPGFPSLQMSAFWRGMLSPIAQYFLEQVKKHAKLLASKL